MASEAQKDGFSCPDAPVLPNECWALYISQPVPRKVMGRMEQAISSCIHRDKYATYIFKKHNIEEAQLDKIETEDPCLVLQSNAKNTHYGALISQPLRLDTICFKLPH